MTSEEKNQARAAKLQEIEAEFQKHVSPSDIIHHHDIDHEGILASYNLWVLKRKSRYNKPLLAPRSEDVDILTRQQEQADMEKMRMFVQLRQDLERVRNLCYMVSRREKLSRSFFWMREETFHKQVAVLTDPSHTLSSTELTAVKEANHGPSIYDRLYSHPTAPDLSTHFETLLARIAGIASPTPEDKNKHDLNGLFKTSKIENPYKKTYVNGGLMRRRSLYGSMSSDSDADKRNFNTKIGSDLSSADDKTSKSLLSKLSSVKEKRLIKKKSISKPAVDTSTEDEEDNKLPKSMWESPRSRSLRQIEKEREELKSGPSDDSDDLVLPFKSTNKGEPNKINEIYSSDSESDLSLREDNDGPSDSQQLVMRTKAAMKEFSAGGIQLGKGKKTIQLSVKSSKSDKKDEDFSLHSSFEDESIKDKENLKIVRKKDSIIKDSVASDLIVPQRQAAKKATESIRCSQGKVKVDILDQELKTISPSPPLLLPVSTQAILPPSPQSSSDDKPKLKPKNKDLRFGKHIRDKQSNDIYEFDKETIDGQEILAYVPQRQAAKKAAAHIKSGMNKPMLPENDSELPKPKGLESNKHKPKEPEAKIKKEPECEKTNKIFPNSLDRKIRRTPKSSVSTSSSSSSSSSGSSSTSSSSETDEESSKKPLDKKKLFESTPLQHKVLNRESPEKLTKSTVRNFVSKKADSTSTSSSSSSSESEVDLSNGMKPMPTRRRSSDCNKFKSIESKLYDTHKNYEDSSKELAGKKFKRTPDKKLKTSDGRPELEFQQPPIEREESNSNRSKNQYDHKGKTRSSSSDRFRSTQTKHGDNSRKTSPIPVTTSKSRSRSRTPKGDESFKPTLDRKSEYISKTEQSKQDGRKRKSNDPEKHSSLSRISNDTNESSKSPEGNHYKKKDVKSQHFGIESKKTDKKIDSNYDAQKNIQRSTESEILLTSKLEREISERKAERDAVAKNTSRKSLDKLLLEKRDKLSQSKNDLNEIINNETCKAEFFEDTDKSSSLKEKIQKKKFSDLQNSHKSSLSSENISPNNNKTILQEESANSCHFNKLNQDMEINFNHTNNIMLENNSDILYDTDLSEVHADYSKKMKTIKKSKSREDEFYNADVQYNVNAESTTNYDLRQDQSVLEFNHIASDTETLNALSLNKQGTLDITSHSTDLKSNVNQLNLEKNTNIPCSDFSVIDSDAEPKKISSRTSSLSIPLNQHRSIFSPQPPSKDSAVAELFDFENDILAVDDSVHEDGFGLPRDSEEMRAPPLTFSFGSEFLFKEDSKEDSARETLNLVEKLRLEYAKKSTQSDLPESGLQDEELPNIPSEEINVEQIEDTIETVKTEDTKPPSVENIEENKQQTIECSVNIMKHEIDQTQIELPIDSTEPNLMHSIKDNKTHNIPNYDTSEQYSGYPPCSLSIEVDKVPGREKLDRSNSAQADERWVPPSLPQPLHPYEVLPSPYPEMNNRNKWADSEILPQRHSSSSSASSTSSSSHREDLDTGKRDERDQLLPPPNPNLLPPELVSFHPNLPFPLSDGPPYHPYSEATPFVAPVALFAPPPTQLPFPSPGAGLYPPPFPAPFPGALMPKPPEEPILLQPPCTAAFTSSSHNMALTAAMVSPNPPLTPMMQEPPLTPAPFSEHCAQLPPPLESPIRTEIQNTENYNHQIPPVSSEASIPTSKSIPGKKSPSKPTRTSARFISLQSKSPVKSPAISPRQSDPVVTKNVGRVRESGGKRGSKPGSRGSSRGRGRGRGRGRAQSHQQHHYHQSDQDPNTLHNKLAGTVYDFNFDEECNESLENLRAMRERRRSTDVHERKSSDSSFLSRDSSQSPKFVSPHQNLKSRSNYNADVRDLRPPTPVNDIINSTVEENSVVETVRVETFPDVQPMLPGPVDMRTYNSYESNSSSTMYHNNLIGTFTSKSIAEQQELGMDDIDKHLDSLSENKSVSLEKNRKENDEMLNRDEFNTGSLPTNKETFDDSRNQLKVKIKGPFLDAKYISQAVTTAQPTLPAPGDSANSSSVGSTTGMLGSGTSNLRRMRKKELLHQYCSQDMNMDESASGVVSQLTTAPTTAPPLNRTVITIPKAVASMTTIPTREDYKDVVDANMEKKRRKERIPNSSDMELFDYDDDNDKRRSLGGLSSMTDSVHPFKRRGRQPRVPTQVSSAPKLKIKFGGAMEPSISTEPNNDERKNLRVRPPKKRLSSMPTPTVEELKRESMKYRKLVMADFEEEDKQKSAGSKSTGRRKKRFHDKSEVQVITPAETAPTKLIIRFVKRSDDSTPPPLVVPSVNPSVPPPPLSRTSSDDGSELHVRTSKTTPIRLKLSRCEEGYVMKESSESVSSSAVEPEPPPVKTPPSTLPLSKDCEVR
uniref:Uncharacterized protein n=1 Tax=Clastoptera arizonana TaxID=38151 RepID=A0A1B6CDY1_9HEMI